MIGSLFNLWDLYISTPLYYPPLYSVDLPVAPDLDLLIIDGSLCWNSSWTINPLIGWSASPLLNYI